MKYFSGKSPKRERREKWMEALYQVLQDRNAKIPCPTCEQENLNIVEVLSKNNSSHKEIYMTCPSCHAREIILIRKGSKT